MLPDISIKLMLVSRMYLFVPYVNVFHWEKFWLCSELKARVGLYKFDLH